MAKVKNIKGEVESYCTLTMTKKGTGYHAYGNDAIMIYEKCGWIHGATAERGYLGASYVIPSNNIDLFLPKLVKAGYKIMIK